MIIFGLRSRIQLDSSHQPSLREQATVVVSVLATFGDSSCNAVFEEGIFTGERDGDGAPSQSYDEVVLGSLPVRETETERWRWNRVKQKGM
uniref:Uncharacterized protein n=1 Tax=Nelumbo nucifera TaxID=4432 RepID=A0A822YYP5_NELNU|nr:TPA_asm: hypothetical protein HUJ06_008298 [Nelumbo nucifera]